VLASESPVVLIPNPKAPPTSELSLSDYPQTGWRLAAKFGDDATLRSGTAAQLEARRDGSGWVITGGQLAKGC
jgi:hypothetical protein